MEHLVIQGETPLRGSVRAEGAKNSALPLLASTLLVEGTSHLLRVPDLQDINTMLQLLQAVGAKVTRSGDQVWVDAGGPLITSTPDHLVEQMRASFLVMGPLAARLGRCEATLPGGCAIGLRPVDLHLRGLSLLGANIHVNNGRVTLQSGRLVGNFIRLDLPSVTATENLLMASTLAQGTTVIENAAQEPEVNDLAIFLTKMGGQIQGIGTSRLIIHGVNALQPATHVTIPDRIEIGTYLMAGAATGGDVTVTGVYIPHLEEIIFRLGQTGLKIEIGQDWIRCRAPERPRAVSVYTAPYPGFPTDLQPPMAAMLATAGGTSVVTETVFDNRFLYTRELQKLGADIRVQGRSAIIKGVFRLSGGQVMGNDLRGAAALLIAGLAAKGTSEVYGIRHLDRGYAAIEQKLSMLGAHIYRSHPVPEAKGSF